MFLRVYRLGVRENRYYFPSTQINMEPHFAVLVVTVRLSSRSWEVCVTTG